MFLHQFLNRWDIYDFERNWTWSIYSVFLINTELSLFIDELRSVIILRLAPRGSGFSYVDPPNFYLISYYNFGSYIDLYKF